MEITLSKIIVWLVVGALAGTLVGAIVKGRKGGYGFFQNLGIGLVGALIGGVVFALFNIDLGLGQIAVTATDVIAAILGTFAFLGVVGIIKKRKKPKAA